jgi:hypothetical protein
MYNEMEKRNVSFVPSIISHLIIKIVQLREQASYHAVTKQNKGKNVGKKFISRNYEYIP